MNLSEYCGKRVTLTRNLAKPNAEGHLAEEVEGIVEVVAPDGSALVIKPRGSTMNMMLEAGEIEPDSIHVILEKPKEIKAVQKYPATLGTVRTHLLNYHGWTLLIVNGLTESEAFEQHDNLTHNQMGHFHQSEED